VSRYRVVITDFLNDGLELEKSLFGDLADIVALDAYHEDELVGHIEDADAVLVYHNLGLSDQSIRRLTRCKIIVRAGVGIDNVDCAVAREVGIPVVNVPDYGTEEVADSAIGLTLALTRGIAPLNSLLQQGERLWSPEHVYPLQRLRGQVFGIVGLGRIGMAAAIRAKALGMHVKFYDPHRDDGYDKAVGVERTETLQELVASAYVVSLHCPLTPETHHLITAETIADMPPRSFLINTARGAVVDTSAIPPAIASGHLAGAGIDVLANEPPADDDPLIVAWRDPNHPAHHRVLVNPHAAFYSQQGLQDMREKAAQAVRRALVGEPLRNVVNQVS